MKTSWVNWIIKIPNTPIFNRMVHNFHISSSFLLVIIILIIATFGFFIWNKIFKKTISVQNNLQMLFSIFLYITLILVFFTNSLYIIIIFILYLLVIIFYLSFYYIIKKYNKKIYFINNYDNKYNIKYEKIQDNINIKDNTYDNILWKQNEGIKKYNSNTKDFEFYFIITLIIIIIIITITLLLY